MKFIASEQFMASNSPSDPIKTKLSSETIKVLFSSGSLITPYLRAAFIPKKRETANPGPEAFRPGAQMRNGPENFPLATYSFATTPPASSILSFSDCRSNRCVAERIYILCSFFTAAMLSPTLATVICRSTQTASKQVVPEKAISSPENSRSFSVSIKIRMRELRSTLPSARHWTHFLHMASPTYLATSRPLLPCPSQIRYTPSAIFTQSWFSTLWEPMQVTEQASKISLARSFLSSIFLLMMFLSLTCLSSLWKAVIIFSADFNLEPRLTEIGFQHWLTFFSILFLSREVRQTEICLLLKLLAFSFCTYLRKASAHGWWPGQLQDVLKVLDILGRSSRSQGSVMILALLAFESRPLFSEWRTQFRERLWRVLLIFQTFSKLQEAVNGSRYDLGEFEGCL